jgi:hypothetical protein
MTRLPLRRSLKCSLFALTYAGHFQLAKTGSIERANQQTIAAEIEIPNKKSHLPKSVNGSLHWSA